MIINIIAGSFDDNGGKPSGWITKLASALITLNNSITLINGGTWDTLNNVYHNLPIDEVVLWFADVPNDKPKLIKELKFRYPKIILVTSKRNLDNEYSVMNLISRSLEVKSNLMIEFTGSRNNILSTILDPLGNAFIYKEADINKVAESLNKRLLLLKSFSRVGSKCLGDAVSVVTNSEILEFIEIVKVQAEQFHTIIHEANTTRMLGNSSFRCQRGFPSFRTDSNIFVSRRNIDKRSISVEEFVCIESIPGSDDVGYFGINKPSVDSPVQLKLYHALPNINYMLHSHTYIEGAPITSECIPCGALEETQQILNVCHNDATNFCVNVRGHGSIVFAKEPSFMSNIKWIPRPIPEIVM
jgi:hypothetical protein